MKRIRNWIDDKIINSIVGRLITKWQDLHPTSYLLIVAISAIAITWSHEVLEQHAVICDKMEFCIKGIEYWAAKVAFYAGIISAVLSGSITISEARNQIKERNKEE